MVIKLIIKELFANLAILVSLLFFYSQVSKKFTLQAQSSVKSKIIVGILGGLLSNILMQYSIPIGTSIIDLRHVPTMLLAYYGGALPALISMIVTIIGRFLIGINTSSYFAILISVPVTFFSIYISSNKGIKKNVKILLMLTFNNIVFSIVIGNVVREYTLLVQILPIYWVVSYVSGYLGFYIIAFLRSSQNLFYKYQKESTIDGLTGLNNVRKFSEVFNNLLHDLKRNGQKLSILYIDIDYFKTINDTYGHSEGDVVLKQLGLILKNCTRTFDIVSRNGGEEFSVLLLDCPLNRAFEIAETIRGTVKDNPFTLHTGEEITLTISIGVASYQDTTLDPTMLIDDADNALYQAKKTGRNKVCVANR